MEMGRTNDKFIPHPFPLKLYDMLEFCHGHERYREVVRWMPNGKSFRVDDEYQFAVDIMPHFFRQSQFKSFQRQLHIYGFKKIRKSDDKGAYFHHMFTRGDRGSVRHMIRSTIEYDERNRHRRASGAVANQALVKDREKKYNDDTNLTPAEISYFLLTQPYNG